MMKRSLSLLLAPLLAAAALGTAHADLDLPRPSPSASIKQTVGLTDISVDYSSPAVKGRKIWGGLLPYGEVWRAGANMATKVTFSRDVVIGATPVAAGSYALFVIPTKTGFTFVINKDFNQGGAFNYKKELDVVRLDVKPTVIPNRERLAYLVSDFTNQQALLELEWEKVRIALPIKLATDEQVAANITNAENSAWQPMAFAARYMLEQKKDYDAGLKLVDKSIASKEEWLNVWTKAQLLAAKGKFKEALPLAEHAQELGQKVTPPQRFFFADEIKKSIGEWKTK